MNKIVQKTNKTKNKNIVICKYCVTCIKIQSYKRSVTLLGRIK